MSGGGGGGPESSGIGGMLAGLKGGAPQAGGPNMQGPPVAPQAGLMDALKSGGQARAGESEDDFKRRQMIAQMMLENGASYLDDM